MSICVMSPRERFSVYRVMDGLLSGAMQTGGYLTVYALVLWLRVCEDLSDVSKWFLM